MAMSTATVTSLDGFHATPAAQRADELVRAFFDAVNADDAGRIDELLDRGRSCPTTCTARAAGPA